MKELRPMDDTETIEYLNKETLESTAKAAVSTVLAIFS